MITIKFRHVEKAKIVRKLIVQHKDYSKNMNVKVKSEYEPLLRIDWTHYHPSYIEELIIPVLKEFIITFVEGEWIKEMISSLFYFTDEEEQQQIMSITRSILEGEKTDLPSVNPYETYSLREKMIDEALRNFITKGVSFSFESFLQFRLKDYRQHLLTYVEAAIDEYKLEQEYQTFIENLRRYVFEKESLISTLHLLHEKSFTFFDETLNRIHDKKLEELIDTSLLNVEEIDLESLVIAPLISIAPRSIHLYTDCLDHGMIQTIQNIFFERVNLHTVEEFYQMKN